MGGVEEKGLALGSVSTWVNFDQSSPKQHKRSTESLAFGQGWHQHVASGPKMEEKPGTNEVMPAIASLSLPLSSPFTHLFLLHILPGLEDSRRARERKKKKKKKM